MTAPPVAVRAGRPVLTGALLGATVLAWMATARLMGGMDAGPWAELGGIASYTAAWVVMMAAMMLPSVLPAVLVYDGVQRRRRVSAPARAARGATPAFVGGYLCSWAAFGVAAYAGLEALRGLDGALLEWGGAGRWLAAGVLLAAAAYQLTPLKDACLSHCRTPLEFMTASWREGRLGAVRMGAAHGSWCVGCCWALMAALFAVGVMSLVWMGLVAGLVAAEKLLPWKRAAGFAVVAVLVLLAAGVALVPDDVPGLAVAGDMAMGR